MDEISHRSPERLVLNLAQLRSASIIQAFQPRHTLLHKTFEDAIEVGIEAHEVSVTMALQKKEQLQAKKLETAKRKSQAQQQKKA